MAARRSWQTSAQDKVPSASATVMHPSRVGRESRAAPAAAARDSRPTREGCITVALADGALS